MFYLCLDRTLEEDSIVGFLIWADLDYELCPLILCSIFVYIEHTLLLQQKRQTLTANAHSDHIAAIHGI